MNSDVFGDHTARGSQRIVCGAFGKRTHASFFASYIIDEDMYA